ncbi:hypothetical protein GTW51_15525 [Aurantimonas aggregata]|uniref:Uncharacterized protein n=2 Tax=Aurantimonas aggregata TaxID=2047720 RepID=A0A6L9MK34_9HYPH|nr:hypothetical protein [Aurantimonas aggregata]NDV88111.1 hypothetical protein [Aurantimonas aggregata]
METPFPRALNQGGAHPVHQAALRLAEVRDGRSRLKAKDLVALLLCHGARAWRSSQPISHTRIRVAGTSGTPALRLRFR